MTAHVLFILNVLNNTHYNVTVHHTSPPLGTSSSRIQNGLSIPESSGPHSVSDSCGLGGIGPQSPIFRGLNPRNFHSVNGMSGSCTISNTVYSVGSGGVSACSSAVPSSTQSRPSTVAFSNTGPPSGSEISLGHFLNLFSETRVVAC